ncbi:MAG: DUF885 domain-containing protein [Verrucomicrobiae bacterium]|nr:DUF885 domain-containing protein [Verrucomicrobiae bacterium]
MKKCFWLSGLLALGCLGISWAAAASAEDQKLADFFRQHLEEQLRQRPLLATELGDHRYDHRLDDISPSARARWKEDCRATLAALPQAVNYQALSRDGQVDYEIFRSSLERTLWLMENQDPWAEDPRVYNQYLNDSIYLVLAQSTLPRETNVSNAIARMAFLPQVVAEARRSLKHPPRVMVETAIRQNRGAINFYEKTLFDLVGRTPQLPRLKAAANAVLPVLRAHQQFLEQELLPRATGNWRLGRDKFSRKLELTLQTGWDADTLLQMAEAEFARVEQELYVVARQLWGVYFPGQVIPPDTPEGRRQTVALVIQRVGQEHGRPADLIKDARATVARIKQFITAADILQLPAPDRCQIIEMPEFQRGNAIAYMNSPPPLDPEATGYYAISPPPRDWPPERVKSFLEEYNQHMLQILTIHEAYPGHYVQHEYANRVPSLIRKVLASGVYVEGWAVYTEQMMLDQGFGAGDLRLRLNQLKFYLRAIANAILDHKMHCTAITDEEALAFLTRRAFQSEGEARLKIIRAQQSSVQLSTYFAGRMAMYQLRQNLQQAMGPRFALGRFHEAVLLCGPVPVKYLPELVRRQLQEKP